MKLVSRLLFATGGHILPDSHLYLPPHLCCSCCTNAKGRLPVVVVRNPFSRLASNWRTLNSATSICLFKKDEMMRCASIWPIWPKLFANILHQFSKTRTRTPAEEFQLAELTKVWPWYFLCNGLYSKTPQIQRRKPCDPCRVFPSLSLSCKGCSLGLPLTPSARRELEAPKSDWTWKWFLNVPLENEISLQSNPFWNSTVLLLLQ